MKQSYFGKLNGNKKRVAIVVAEFNDFITRRLLDSAVLYLKKAGMKESQIKVVWVPGALEVPFFCKAVKHNLNCDGVIALACVLRGETYHYECVAHEITRGISQVALESSVPIATGVLTLDTLEQAIDRAGLKSGNKGAQAAQAVLEMISLISALRPRRNRKIKSARKKHA